MNDRAAATERRPSRTNCVLSEGGAPSPPKFPFRVNGSAARDSRAGKPRATLTSRRRPELIAIVLPAFEPGRDVNVVAVRQRNLELMELVLELTQRAQHFVAVLFQDAAPEL